MLTVRYVIYLFLSVRPSVRLSVYLLGCVLHVNECTYRQTFSAKGSKGAIFRQIVHTFLLSDVDQPNYVG